MGTHTPPLALAPATVLVSDRRAGPAAPARRDSRITFGGGLVTLGEAILVALAVPFMVVALPLVLLALLVLTILRARSRRQGSASTSRPARFLRWSGLARRP